MEDKTKDTEENRSVNYLADKAQDGRIKIGRDSEWLAIAAWKLKIGYCRELSVVALLQFV